MKLLIRNQNQVIRHTDYCFAVRRCETKKRLCNRIFFGKNLFSPYAEVPRRIVCSDFSGRIETIYFC